MFRLLKRCPSTFGGMRCWLGRHAGHRHHAPHAAWH